MGSANSTPLTCSLCFRAKLGTSPFNSAQLAASRLAYETTTEQMSLDTRRSIVADAKGTGGKAGAEYLHKHLPALYWGVTRQQLLEFVDNVRLAVQNGKVVNFSPEHLPKYPQEVFETRGPNMHQVTDGFIKPFTDVNAIIPFASYSLVTNHTEGLRIDVYISHAWGEGVYEFGRNAANGWPYGLSGAYVCCLSNPQHLDINEISVTPGSSPFSEVLKARPALMLMLVNKNTPIHSRLWCVYEANCAKDLCIPLEISGDPKFLVPVDVQVKIEETMSTIIGAIADGDRDADGAEAAAALRRLFLDIHFDVRKATCSRSQDREKIWGELEGKEAAVYAAIKNVMLSAATESHHLSRWMATRLMNIERMKAWNKLKLKFDSPEVDVARVYEEGNNLRKVFNLLDRSHKGSFGMDECRALFTASQIERIFQLAGKDLKDTSAQLVLQELVDLMRLQYEVGEPFCEIAAVFDLLDTNKDGLLDVQEIQACAQSLGEHVADDEVQKMLQDVIGNPNGMSVNDFYGVMQERNEESNSDDDDLFSLQSFSSALLPTTSGFLLGSFEPPKVPLESSWPDASRL